MPAGGMRSDDRGRAELHHLPEGLIGDMGDIDEHPEPVHFCDNLSAKGAEPLVRMSGVVGRVRDVVVFRVSERDVADPSVVEMFQVRVFSANCACVL